MFLGIFLGKRKQTTEERTEESNGNDRNPCREKRDFKDLEDATHFLKDLETSKTARYVLKKCPKDFGQTGNIFLTIHLFFKCTHF